MKSIVKLFFLWVGLTIVIFVFETIAFSSTEYEKFLTRGAKVEGIVEKKEPQNHESITYSYVVDGKQYTGTGAAGFGTPPFDVLRVGTKIIVYYDANEPQKSIPGEPELYIQRNSGHPYFLTLFGPLLVIFGIYRKGWI
jgi:hypothetical protein